MSDKKERYVSVLFPDKRKLSRLLIAAKGVDRTMLEFSKLCGMSPTTFSRITQRKIKKPLSDSLIEKLAEHSDDPVNAGYDAFMRANGKVPESETDKLRNSMTADEREVLKLKSDLLNNSRTIITDELYARDFSLVVFPGYFEAEEMLKLEPSKFGLGMPSSFCIKLKGFESDVWNFIIDPYEYDPDVQYSIKLHGFSQYGTLVMDTYSPVFLRDAWEAELRRRVKTLFVFFRRDTFDAFRETVSGITINSEMSLLLVDLRMRRVVAEKLLTREDGREHFLAFNMKRKMIFGNSY